MYFYQAIDGTIYRRSFKDGNYKKIVTNEFPNSEAACVTELLNEEYVRGVVDGQKSVKQRINEALTSC